MFKASKRLVAALLAGAVIVSSAVSAFAAGNGSATTVESPSGTVTAEVENGEATVTEVANEKSAYVTAKINGVPVTEIASGALKDSAKLEKITLGSNVTSIQSGAFTGAKKLTLIKIRTKKKVTINKNAFKGLKKSQLSKIKVKVNKSMSKKNFKALKTALKKIGITKVVKYKI